MPCCCVQSAMLGRRLRKRCSRSAVWLPAVTFSIDVGLGWCLQRAWVPHLHRAMRAWAYRAPCQNRPELRPIRLPALLRLRRRVYASCRAKKSPACNCTRAVRTSPRARSSQLHCYQRTHRRALGIDISLYSKYRGRWWLGGLALSKASSAPCLDQDDERCSCSPWHQL